MDGRHEYILSTVAERLSMSLEDAEEFMIDGDQVCSLKTSNQESSCKIMCLVYPFIIVVEGI